MVGPIQPSGSIFPSQGGNPPDAAQSQEMKYEIAAIAAIVAMTGQNLGSQISNFKNDLNSGKKDVDDLANELNSLMDLVGTYGPSLPHYDPHDLDPYSKLKSFCDILISVVTEGMVTKKIDERTGDLIMSYLQQLETDIKSKKPYGQLARDFNTYLNWADIILWDPPNPNKIMPSPFVAYTLNLFPPFG